MLAIWRLHGLDTALRRAYEHGTVLAGMSAGAAC
ncbi:Type 1 glutamine amidotransferase-like domain-containing protein [Corynebacterium sp.]